MIYQLLFSATGRSKKVMDIIAGQWEGEKIEIDLSDPDFDEKKYNFTKEDFYILTVSVFEGRIPSPAAAKLKKLQGKGAKVLLVAVFGNRAVDDCLLEMRDVMTEAGFVPVAAIEASVQHSIINVVADERPDAEDTALLKDFAEKVKSLVSEKQTFGQLKVPGKFPYVEMGGVPYKPAGNESCIECGLCAEKCPVMAIPADNPRSTDRSKCITCMRCVDICPVGARNFPQELIYRTYRKMKPLFEERKPDKLYIAE